MINYPQIAQLASDQISEAAGDRVVWLGRVTGTYDPVAGAFSSGNVTGKNVTAVVLPFATYVKKELDNRLIEALREGRLRKVLVAGLNAPFEPSPNDLFYFDSAWWHIFGSQPVAPSNTPLVYKCLCERRSLGDLTQVQQ